MTGATVSAEPSTDRSRSIGCGDDLAGEVLTALSDRDCRCILSATEHRARTASELGAECDIPQSTLYRKLELLTDTGLLEERVRLGPDGNHPSEYARAVDDVVVGVEDCGVRVDVRTPLRA